MSGEYKLIACRQIESPKGSLNDNTLNFLESSIRIEGLLQPIVVRPHPDRHGHYKIVAGRHRLHVVAKRLKAEVIEAKVFDDMDEEEARLASLSENVCRGVAANVKRIKLIQEWQAIYREKYPEMVGKAAGGHAKAKKARKAAQAEAATGQAGGDPATLKMSEAGESEVKAEPEAGSGEQMNFRDRVAEATGRSQASVGRDITVANAFTPDELEVFEQMEVCQADMLAVARIKDAELRRQTVALIASGMEPKDAFREVIGAEEVAGGEPEAGAAADEAKAEPEAQAQAEPKAEATTEYTEGGDGRPDSALSDDEWFDKYCRVLAGRLANPARYKADAILFRKVADARTAFRKKVKVAVKKAQDKKLVGTFFLLVNRLINLSHPRDWFLCDGCVGKGTNPNGGDCKKCIGAGFLVRTEKYL